MPLNLILNNRILSILLKDRREEAQQTSAKSPLHRVGATKAQFLLRVFCATLGNPEKQELRKTGGMDFPEGKMLQQITGPQTVQKNNR